MSEFNWDAYGRWEARMEWQNEPHEEGCDCKHCVIEKISKEDYEDSYREEV